LFKATRSSFLPVPTWNYLLRRLRVVARENMATP
jgi:hypothetical protein